MPHTFLLRHNSIMDALDPNDNIEFASGLYNSSTFERSLMNALVDNGVLVAQLGKFPIPKQSCSLFTCVSR